MRNRFINQQGERPAFITGLIMSEALQDKEDTQGQEPQLCVKCKAMFGNRQFEEKCSACFKQDKKDGQEQTGREETGFATPVKNPEELRRSQLLHAPKKHIASDSEQEGSEQQSESQEIDPSEISQNLNESEKEEESVSIDFCFQPPAKTQPVSEPRKRVIVLKGEPTSTLPEQPHKRTYLQYTSEEQVKQVKGRCYSCNRKTGMLGTSCRHCTFQFCNSHRLPENHSCEVDFAGEFKKKRREELQELRPKSKGKLAPI